MKFLEDVKRREKQEREEKYVAVLKWISGAHVSLDQEDAYSARQDYPGTGKWILKKDKIRN